MNNRKEEKVTMAPVSLKSIVFYLCCLALKKSFLKE